jgi:hypothetical protein
VTTEKLLSPEFIQALYERTLSYFVGADSFKDSLGRRFQKTVINDPVFRAISYCRAWAVTNQRAIALPVSWRPDSKNEELLAHEFVHAVSTGNLNRLRDLIRFCERIEDKLFKLPKRHSKRDSIPWHYYIGITACQFLLKGTVPTKKDVTEAALQERAIFEAAVWDKSWESNWSNLQKQQGNKKPDSVKDLRAVKVQAKIEELRGLLPNRRTRARIFKDLGISDLPSAPTRPKKQAAKEAEPLTRDNPSVPKELIDKLYQIAGRGGSEHC